MYFCTMWTLRELYNQRFVILKMELFITTWNEIYRKTLKSWWWERLKAKGEGGRQKMRWLDSITDSKDMNLSTLLDLVKDRRAWHASGMGRWVRQDLATRQEQIKKST